MVNSRPEIEKLAAEIGDKVYMDIAKWHLYLNDAKLHDLLAERLYPLLTDDPLTEDKVMEILKEISIKIGGGKREVPLVDLIPMHCQVDLMDLLEDYQRNL